ncbi:hypothetical protein [Chachezhania sediminis]|uniref:hypothetical protein n=1 Tax=Chachezhania sediminis TaxID=2599291 RepID=UPI00131CFE56|nr:hypothetical protein [Chachezhania sediminis]
MDLKEMESPVASSMRNMGPLDFLQQDGVQPVLVQGHQSQFQVGFFYFFLNEGAGLIG